ncbi:MAG: T9SS type A sorting domain-containing protein [Bacteroidetes bacterium]|nr:MAG: T9SS type A sorting domain-containing protein [Bacteroidota bacterium]
MKKIFTLFSILSVSITALWAQATPNPGFENWTTQGFPSYTSPDDWDDANSQTAIIGSFGCIKATAAADIHSGSAAVKLITKSLLGNLAPGVVTTGTLPTSASGSISGGIPYTLRPDSIIGWYKSAPMSGDTCFVKFMLFGAAAGNADTIAEATFYAKTTVNTYTRFAAPLVYGPSVNPVVNSIWLLSSSINSTIGVVGSTLFADDLALVINPTTAIVEQQNPELTVAPNPVMDHIIIKNTSRSKVTFVLYDATGRKVTEEKTVNAANIDVHTLPDGLYIYAVTDENNTAIKSGKLVIQK